MNTGSGGGGDRDGDGVPDAQDRCPDTPGPASNEGCPPNLLSDASFELGGAAWRPGAHAGSVNYAAYEDSSRAREGSWFLEMNTSQVDASVLQDVSVATTPGQSYTFSIWARVADGSPFHDLRHTFVSAYIKVVKGNVAEVQRALGHAKPDITLRTYTHEFEALNDDREARRARLSEAFGD